MACCVINALSSLPSNKGLKTAIIQGVTQKLKGKKKKSLICNFEKTLRFCT